MRNFLFLPLLLLAAPLAAQDVELPPATMPPPPSDDIQAVLVPVQAVFDGLAAHDPAMITPHLIEGATVTVADSTGAAPAVRRSIFAEQLAGLPSESSRLEERMPNPIVDIDGDIAMVWGFYRFYEDGTFTHCGADHFSLVREEGAWKIADLAYSMRTTDCGE